MQSPPAAGGQVAFGGGGAASSGTSVTSGASGNTKTATWTQIISSTAHHADGIVVHLLRPGTAAVDIVVDIAFGGAGVEVIVAANLIVCNGTGAPAKGCAYHLPIQVPKGTRISAKSASNGSSIQCFVGVTLLSVLPGSVEPYQRVDTYGARLTGGVQVDPGATANTKGAWSAIGTATQPVEGIIVGLGNRASSAKSSVGFLLDVQVAFGGGSATLIPDYPLETSTNDDTIYPGCTPFLPFQCPTGGTINARALCGGTVSPDRLFDVVVYAVS